MNATARLLSAAAAERAGGPGYRPPDVARAAWAASRLAAADYRVGDAALGCLAALAARVDGSFPPRDAAMAAAAFAAAGFDDGRVLAACCESVLGGGEWSLRDAADALWAHAKLGRVPPLAAFAALAGGPSVARALDRGADAPPAERDALASAAWAAAATAHAAEEGDGAGGAAYGALAAPLVGRVATALAADVGARPSPRRTQRLRAWHHARLAVRALAGAETVDAYVAPRALVAAAAREWRDRPAAPSERHAAVKRVLDAMAADHGVVASSADEYGGLAVDILVSLPNGAKIAVEIDGPSHFCANDLKRPLGHTLLKRRLLAAADLAPVAIPYFEWDRIPHWSSMERKRYLQRKLGIKEILTFGTGGDASSFAPLDDDDGEYDDDGGSGGEFKRLA